MNNQRRKQIKNIIKELENCQLKIEDVLSDEEWAFENMPESLQGSMRGMQSEEDIDYLNEAKDSMDEVMDLLNQASEKIDEVVESLEEVY